MGGVAAVVVTDLSEPPRCPMHPSIILNPVNGSPLVAECLHGHSVVLQVPNRIYRKALVAEWPR